MNYKLSQQTQQTKKTARVRTLFIASNHMETNMRKPNFFFAAIFVLVLAGTISPAQAQTQNFTVLHQFDSQTDGAFSQGALLRDAAGNLYGTTTSGGPGLDNGTVFKIDSTGQEKVLLAFDAFVSGDFPTGTLIQDSAGNLYGIAAAGPGGAGVIYKLSQQGEQQILFAFQGGLDNNNPTSPAGGLLMDKAGSIFGTAHFGSNTGCELGCGSVFRLDTAGVLAFTPQVHRRLGRRQTNRTPGSRCRRKPVWRGPVRRRSLMP